MPTIILNTFSEFSHVILTTALWKFYTSKEEIDTSTAIGTYFKIFSLINDRGSSQEKENLIEDTEGMNNTLKTSFSDHIGISSLNSWTPFLFKCVSDYALSSPSNLTHTLHFTDEKTKYREFKSLVKEHGISMFRARHKSINPDNLPWSTLDHLLHFCIYTTHMHIYIYIRRRRLNLLHCILKQECCHDLRSTNCHLGRRKQFKPQTKSMLKQLLKTEIAKWMMYNCVSLNSRATFWEICHVNTTECT